MRVLAFVAVVLLVSGCAALGVPEQRVGSAVERVCGMSEVDRAAARARLDAVVDPHQVRVICAEEE